MVYNFFHEELLFIISFSTGKIYRVSFINANQIKYHGKEFRNPGFDDSLIIIDILRISNIGYQVKI